MIVGLLLALVSAALINLGFLAQHRGLHQSPDGGPLAMLRAAIRNPVWLGGQALGWAGFALQIAAVAIAPLSLVQAFAAGGLALSVPLAARIFGQRVSPAQRLAVLLMAAGLATLPLGLPHIHDHLDSDRLALVMVICGGLGLAIVPLAPAWTKAIAAGVFYGIADAAIKAVSVTFKVHGSSALLSGWTAVAAFGTFAGFLAFQAALHHDDAVSAIALMNAFAALLAAVFGLLAFGESLGSDPWAVIMHVVAIAVVLGCVPVLAAAQAALAEPTTGRGERANAQAEAIPAG
ncbi:MAG: hypothetical protein WAK93_13820 [Solirubrobacteraceae bacterium]